MTNAQFQALVKLVAAQVQKQPKPSKKAAKPAMNTDGLSDRQVKNNQAVVRAFKKNGLAVTPRVDVLSYNGWLAKGQRVVKGQKGTYVKGVGTLFHASQVAPDTQPENQAA